MSTDRKGDSEMVERVARAIEKAGRDYIGPGFDLGKSHDGMREAQARAAIEAMQAFWQAMIDEALGIARENQK